MTEPLFRTRYRSGGDVYGVHAEEQRGRLWVRVVATLFHPALAQACHGRGGRWMYDGTLPNGWEFEPEPDVPAQLASLDAMVRAFCIGLETEERDRGREEEAG